MPPQSKLGQFKFMYICMVGSILGSLVKWYFSFYTSYIFCILLCCVKLAVFDFFGSFSYFMYFFLNIYKQQVAHILYHFHMSHIPFSNLDIFICSFTTDSSYDMPHIFLITTTHIKIRALTCQHMPPKCTALCSNSTHKHTHTHVHMN